MFLNSLSGRFLGLTVVFVMIAEVLIFAPSVARFREDYLQNRLDLAQLAALASLGTTNDVISPELEEELLQTAGVLNIVLRRDGVRELVLASDLDQPIEGYYDIATASPVTLVKDALLVFSHDGNRLIHVMGETRQGAEGGVEIVMHEAPLRQAMVEYGLRVFYLSLAISIATAGLLFFAVRRLIVRPINRVVNHMVAYRDDPENAARIIEPASSTREIKQAEVALHDLEVRLTGALRQKERLASLGSALAKVSHDLRNMLTTTQLLADGFASSDDPRVRRTAPKLVNSLSRAVNLCERTLTFGKAEEPSPVLEQLVLANLVNEVIDNERHTTGSDLVGISSEVPEGLKVLGDPEQLFRVLSNLVRNAAQAINGSNAHGSVRVSAQEAEGTTIIRVADTGPGLPKQARENLFRPFQGGTRKEGSGLGLAIAAEIIRGHGGELMLEISDEDGTTFAITLPAPR